MEDPTDDSAIQRRAAFIQEMNQRGAVLPPPPPPDHDTDTDTCVICSDAMVTADGRNNDDLGRLNNCSHIYHRICIEKWATQQTTCPCCKADFESINGVLVARRRLAKEGMTSRLRGMF
jgi:Ring finger domain